MSSVKHNEEAINADIWVATACSKETSAAATPTPATAAPATGHALSVTFHVSGMAMLLPAWPMLLTQSLLGQDLFGILFSIYQGSNWHMILLLCFILGR